MSKEIYEKLGLFYLGRDVDQESMKTTDALTLLKNSNFTTHAVIIGMTGSGKTGLGISLIEEAAIDNIPSILIDPKGDMGNLSLCDPTFSGDKFTPWVRDEAIAKGVDPQSYGQEVADSWKAGLESWGQDASRAEKFNAVKKTIYTPGSSAGLPINIMASLKAPSAAIMDESDTLGSFLKSTVSSLLSLVGIVADPIDSKEYGLLAQIIMHKWQEGKSISIEELIGSIINPPFDKVGVLPLNLYYAQEQRFAFATKFNAVIASPSFSIWLKGDNLDIQKLLYDEDGKAKIAIFSIAHLNDDERMFFVTILLNNYIAWMRQQSGTSSLKTILYMDEIFGFFPPTKNPPSKEPMLLLLKQARAYGVGVILSTQNPVDLDYKGLSNIGTWFIGRLQTAQDIDRVIEGLEGKDESGISKESIRKLLSSMPKRTFFLKSAHLDDIRLFSTRWVLSYLKGPLKKEEISILMQEQKELQKSQTIMPQSLTSSYESSQTQPEILTETYLNTLDNTTTQFYEIDSRGIQRYTPTLMSRVRVGFFSQSKGVDEKETETLTLYLEPTSRGALWEDAHSEELEFQRFPTKASENMNYEKLPNFIQEDKGLKKSKKALEDMLYRDKKLELFYCSSPKLQSNPHETLGNFKVHLQDKLNEEKDAEIEKLKEQYASKEDTLTTRMARAKERVEKEQADVSNKTTDTLISTGIAIFGALLGKKTSTSSIGSVINKGSSVIKERGDVSRAEKQLQEISKEIEDLGYELEDKISLIDEKLSIEKCKIETLTIKPKRSDIVIEDIALVWRSDYRA